MSGLPLKSSGARPAASDDALLFQLRHLAQAARAYSPEAYSDLQAPGSTASVEHYLRAASWEVGYVLQLLSDAARLTGSRAAHPGSLWRLALELRAAISAAADGLDSGDVLAVAKAFTAVALLWRSLRERQAEIEGLEGDVQLAATRDGEQAAERQLRALAEAGERPIGSRWREEAQDQFTLGPRAVRRVWDSVAKDFQQLSSAQGKPKARRPKA